MIPVYEEPDLTGAQPLERVPRTFGEQVTAAWREQRHIANTNARQHFQDEIWNERLDEFEAASGVRLPHPRNPLDPRFLRQQSTSFNLFGSVDGEGESSYAQRVEFVERQISHQLSARPELAAQIRPREIWDEEMRTRAAEIFEEARDGDLVPSLIGAAGAAFTDPVNVMSLPLGGGGSVLRVAATEAFINLSLEGVALPVEAKWRAELGLDDLTLGEAGMRLGAGALFGGVVGGAGRAADLYGGQAVREAWARLPMQRQAEALRELADGDDLDIQGIADLLDRQAEIDAANPFGAGIEAEARHGELFEWAAEAARGEEMSPGNPYRDLGPPRNDLPGETLDAPREQLQVLRADQADWEDVSDELVPTGRMIVSERDELELEFTTRREAEEAVARETSLMADLRRCAIGGAG